MGPGKRVTVAPVASWYSVLRLPEDLGFQTGLWTPRWTPWDRVTAAFILPVYDVHGDVSPCMTSLPGQQLLAVSLQRLLYQPVAAIPWLLEGCNQGLVGLDYQYTGYAGA